jgi:hypothetical protein
LSSTEAITLAACPADSKGPRLSRTRAVTSAASASRWPGDWITAQWPRPHFPSSAARVRHRRIPPPLADREELPDVQTHHLQARPIYHHKRESIEAHLNIAFAALAVSHWIEHQTGWSIKKFIRTARRYRTVQIRAGQQTLTAADLIPDHLREAITKINSPDSAR